MSVSNACSSQHNRRGMLTSERRVAGDALDQGAEDGADADTSTAYADGGKTSALHLSGDDQSSSRSFGNDTAGLHGATDDA